MSWRARPDPYPVSSYPKSRRDRWEESRALCLSDLCMYEHACPIAAQRARYVPKRDCFNHWLPEDRPRPDLSPFARRLLAEYREQAMA